MSLAWVKEINYLFYETLESPDFEKYSIYLQHFFVEEQTGKEHGLMYYYLQSLNYSFFYGDLNKIIGIGLIRNHPINGKLNVYCKGNYNRYTFVGRTRIDRSEMNEEEDLVMKIFDILCFRGNKHMKRGQGLKSFPTELLFILIKKVDLVKYIGNMFKERLLNLSKETNK